MKTLADIFIVAVLGLGFGGLGIFIAASFALARGRFAIDEVFEAVERHDYDGARRAILRAVRILPTLRRVQDLHEYYELLQTRNPERIEAELSRLRDARAHWPKTREETIYLDKRLRVFLVIFMIAIGTLGVFSGYKNGTSGGSVKTSK